MYYAAICAIAKNEECFIEEWVHYHLSIGFEHIYIYDNNSRVPISKILSGYVDSGLVTVIDFSTENDQQRAAYMDSLRRYGEQCRWMAFIDIDEFIVQKSTDDIRNILDKYIEYGGLGIHWKMIGSCGHKCRPSGNVIENYDTVISYDAHIKSIVQPSRVDRIFTPHNFGYKNGYFCVNEDAIPVASHQSYHVSRTVWINHYYYKSLEDFKEKLSRGCATGADRNFEEEISGFARQENLEGKRERTIQLLHARKSDMRTYNDICTYLDDCKKSSDEFENQIVDCVAINKIEFALYLLNVYLRYYDTAFAWLFAARIYLLAGRPADCPRYMRKLLVDVDSPLRTAAYDCLVDYYKGINDMDTAEKLKSALS